MSNLANPYADSQYSPAEGKLSSTPQSSSRASKRKRENDTNITSTTGASPSAGRGAPTPRRSSEHTHAPADPVDVFTEGNQAANQFDLSALQAHQNPGHPQHSSGSQSNIDSTAAAALNYTMNVPGPPAQDFASQPTTGMDGQPMSDFQGLDNGSAGIGAQDTPGHEGGLASPGDTAGMSGKPTVGSDEWHKVRKDNHKEVERRRRETINEGINELAKIVPGCEKNKGSILARAVQYIGKLQDDAHSNIDKWTFEKLVTEQAISDLSAKLSRCVRERDAWMRIAKENGVNVDSVDLGIDGDEGEENGQGGDTQDATSQQSQAQQQSSPQVANMGQTSNGDSQKRDGNRP